MQEKKCKGGKKDRKTAMVLRSRRKQQITLRKKSKTRRSKKCSRRRTRITKIYRAFSTEESDASEKKELRRLLAEVYHYVKQPGNSVKELQQILRSGPKDLDEKHKSELQIAEDLNANDINAIKEQHVAEKKQLLKQISLLTEALNKVSPPPIPVKQKPVKDTLPHIPTIQPPPI